MKLQNTEVKKTILGFQRGKKKKKEIIYKGSRINISFNFSVVTKKPRRHQSMSVKVQKKIYFTLKFCT